MSYPIKDLEGIGPKYAKKLADAGIKTTAGLLGACAAEKGRKAVSETTGLSTKNLLKWANLADLMRIKGIATQYSELLEAAGVDTVKELRNRNAKNLAAKMQEVNAKKKRTRVTPPEVVVTTWVAAAKKTKPMITH